MTVLAVFLVAGAFAAAAAAYYMGADEETAAEATATETVFLPEPSSGPTDDATRNFGSDLWFGA